MYREALIKQESLPNYLKYYLEAVLQPAGTKWSTVLHFPWFCTRITIEHADGSFRNECRYVVNYCDRSSSYGAYGYDWGSTWDSADINDEDFTKVLCATLPSTGTIEDLYQRRGVALCDPLGVKAVLRWMQHVAFIEDGLMPFSCEALTNYRHTNLSGGSGRRHTAELAMDEHVPVKDRRALVEVPPSLGAITRSNFGFFEDKWLMGSVGCSRPGEYSMPVRHCLGCTKELDPAEEYTLASPAGDSSCFCRECYESHKQECSECGYVFHLIGWDRSRLLHYGELVCDHCKRLLRQPVKPYNYKPRTFWYNGKRGRFRANELFLGVELEIESGDEDVSMDSKNEVAVEINEILGPLSYCKHDGSLLGGFEIVTMPSTLAHLKDNFDWDRVRKITKAYGYNGGKGNGCGLHVHLSRSYFKGGCELSILDYFVDNCAFQLEQLGGRSLDTKSCKRYAAKRNLGKQNAYALKCRAGYSESRYQAVNFCNSETVELRFMKSTDDKELFWTRIELADAIARFIRNTSIARVFPQDDCGWGLFVSFVKGHDKRYVHLKDVLSDVILPEPVKPKKRKAKKKLFRLEPTEIAHDEPVVTFEGEAVTPDVAQRIRCSPVLTSAYAQQMVNADWPPC